eukprot:17258-Heterococcus_DN1.PRE.3
MLSQRDSARTHARCHSKLVVEGTASWTPPLQAVVAWRADKRQRGKAASISKIRLKLQAAARAATRNLAACCAQRRVSACSAEHSKHQELDVEQKVDMSDAGMRSCADAARNSLIRARSCSQTAALTKHHH